MLIVETPSLARATYTDRTFGPKRHVPASHHSNGISGFPLKPNNGVYPHTSKPTSSRPCFGQGGAAALQMRDRTRTAGNDDVTIRTKLSWKPKGLTSMYSRVESVAANVAGMKKSTSSRELVLFGCVDSRNRIEVLHAKFDRHAFTAHAHDTWAIGAVIAGAKDTAIQRSPRNVVRAGEWYALRPHTVHAGKTVGDVCEYSILYVPDEEWRHQCQVSWCLPGTSLLWHCVLRIRSRLTACTVRCFRITTSRRHGEMD
ncbi:AraC family ligand binding domain-containing protein [Cupriavidus basilensis]